MLKILRDLWSKNELDLREALKNLENEPTYEDLVRLTFEKIYNNGCQPGYYHSELDIDNITKIDNGDYQGTLVFLIPFDCYQPGAGDYLMTYVGYGSCSGCDTLMSITMCGTPPYTDEQIKDLLTLCKDIVTNAIKPYNYGWRHDETFDRVEFEEDLK